MSTTPAPVTDDQAVNSLIHFGNTIIERLDFTHDAEALLSRLQEMTPVASGILFGVGMLCLFKGYEWHKWLVAIIAAVIAGATAHTLTDSDVVWPVRGAITLMCAFPMMKPFAAALTGGSGAIVGANTWSAFLPESSNFFWAGGAIGFIMLTLLSFLVFRIATVFMVSVLGGLMASVGGLSLLLQVPGLGDSLITSINGHNFVMPSVIGLAAVGAFVWQEVSSRNCQNV